MSLLSSAPNLNIVRSTLKLLGFFTILFLLTFPSITQAQTPNFRILIVGSSYVEDWWYWRLWFTGESPNTFPYYPTPSPLGPVGENTNFQCVTNENTLQSNCTETVQVQGTPKKGQVNRPTSRMTPNRPTAPLPSSKILKNIDPKLVYEMNMVKSRAKDLLSKNQTCYDRIRNTVPNFPDGLDYIDLLDSMKRIVFFSAQACSNPIGGTDAAAITNRTDAITINFIAICPAFFNSHDLDTEVAFFLHELSHATIRLDNDNGWGYTQYRGDLHDIGQACDLNVKY